MRVSTAMPVSGIEEHRDFGLAQVRDRQTSQWEEMMKEMQANSERMQREMDASLYHQYKYLWFGLGGVALESLIAYIYFKKEDKYRKSNNIPEANAHHFVGNMAVGGAVLIAGMATWSHFESRRRTEASRLYSEKMELERQRAAVLPPTSTP
jgi:hypothetical protein